MQTMLLKELGDIGPDSEPLVCTDIDIPEPQAHEVLIRVHACAVCHTELDEIEARTPPPRLPVVPGHQVIGTVERCGECCRQLRPGTRVGVAWIFSSCGRCDLCLSGDENLCSEFVATGRDVNGGYAEYMTVAEDFAHVIPDSLDTMHAAPLLCAGAIGYRSLRLTGLLNGQRLGLTGFGASAHLVLKMVQHRFPDSPVYVFARDGGVQSFARELGASWAGGTEDQAPEPLDAIIDTTPAWLPIVAALSQLRPAGRLVINAIRKEERDKEALLRLDYPAQLWQEKEIKSVANVARLDVAEFLQLAAAAGIKPVTETYALTDANRALRELKLGGNNGAKVLITE